MSEYLYLEVQLSISEEYVADNVTVTVEWAEQLYTLVYYARVSPLAPIKFTGSASHELTISYNTEYNLSIEVVTPCGNATIFTRLNYGNYILMYITQIDIQHVHNIIT